MPAPSGVTIVVTIPSQFGDLRVTIEHDGILASSRAATAAELARVDLGQRDIRLVNRTDTDLLLGWIGSVCERFATLRVERGRVALAPAPRSGCDASAFGWGLALRTKGPVDATSFEVVQLPTTILP